MNNFEKHGESVSERELVRYFIGENRAAFMPIYDAMIERDKLPMWIGWKNYNFMALFFSIAWLFYRKLWISGILLLVIPVLLQVFLGKMGSLTLLPALILTGQFANAYYVDMVRRDIREIFENSHSIAQVRETISKKGGTSPIGAAFAAIAFIILPLIFSILETIGRNA